MPTPQDPQAAAAIIDRISSRRMGVDPQAPAAPQPSADPAAGQMAPQAPAQAAPPPPPQDTIQDKAAEQGSPQTEGDKSRAEAVVYEIDLGEGKKRNMTPQQIAAMSQRYAGLNYEHMQLKPAIDVIKSLLQSSKDLTPAQLADRIKNIAAADGPATFGADSGQNPNQPAAPKDGSNNGQSPNKPMTNEQLSAQLDKWAEDNAVDLPPGYKEMMLSGNQSRQSMDQMTQQMQAMQMMLRQVLGAASGTADAAAAGVQATERRQVDAIRQTIMNNLDGVQRELELADDAAEDFMTFAMERGFTFEDFVNPELLRRVAQDFKANMQGPEMERIRAIHQRRQAYTGSLGSPPSSGGAAPADQGGDPRLNRMIDQTMSKKMMG